MQRRPGAAVLTDKPRRRQRGIIAQQSLDRGDVTAPNRPAQLHCDPVVARYLLAVLPLTHACQACQSAPDQVGRTNDRGQGVGVAGARVHVNCGVGELDHVLITVVDCPVEGLLGRCVPAGGPGSPVRAAGTAGA